MLGNCYYYTNKYIMNIYLKIWRRQYKFSEFYWREYNTKLTSHTGEPPPPLPKITIRNTTLAYQGWLTYDKQYRLRASSKPTLDWGVVDAELWMLYITPTSSQSELSPLVKVAKCFDHNIKGSSNKTNSPYIHRCLNSNSMHSFNKCSAGSPAQADKLNRPFCFNAPNRSQPQLPYILYSNKFRANHKQQSLVVPGNRTKYQYVTIIMHVSTTLITLHRQA